MFAYENTARIKLDIIKVSRQSGTESLMIFINSCIISTDSVFCWYSFHIAHSPGPVALNVWLR